MDKLSIPVIIFQVCIHVFGGYGIYIMTTQSWKWATLLYCWVSVAIALSIGLNAAIHRYFSHRAYSATKPLRYLLAVAATFTLQNSILWWVVVHRMHHKYADTDKDPHSIKRGFWYAHILWIFTTRERYSKLIEFRKEIDMSDLEQDPMIVFQDKYFYWLMSGIVIISTWVPWFFWSESLIVSFCIGVNLRLCISFNIAFMLGSVSHMVGYRPYEQKFKATNNELVSYLTGGEGGHNFHHVFPTDYRQNELAFNPFNPAARFIELCAWLGLAYNLKTASVEVVHKRARRTGDGSIYPNNKSNHEIDPKEEYIFEGELEDRVYTQTK